mgnify:CR=1 FL=1
MNGRSPLLLRALLEQQYRLVERDGLTADIGRRTVTVR